MKKLIATGLLGVAFAAGCPEPVAAHGGQYRGPGDIVPPGTQGRGPGGGRGPNTPGPRGPNQPGGGATTGGSQSGPTSGGPTSGTNGAARTGGGASAGPDLNRWQFWWELNKDPFINLKQAIHAAGTVTGSDEFFMGGSRTKDGNDSLAPTERHRDEILLALKSTLDTTENRDIISSCLIAMAKIGRDHEQFAILDVMRPHLQSSVQEVREVAALSMGISRMPAALGDLVELAQNSPAGQKLCRSSKVDNRTRSFACYALGLIANATSSTDNKRRCFDALAEVLRTTTESLVDRNVPVAAINGIRLIRPDAHGSSKDRALFEDCVATLWSYYEKPATQTEQQVQAHVPPAIAQLVGRDHPDSEPFKRAFADLLAGKLGKKNNNLYQSAVIALGLLCQPEEVDAADKPYLDALRDYYREGRNEQARYFALMALAKIGGNKNRNELLMALANGSKALVKPWAAISLGVLAFRANEAGDRVGPDVAIGEAIRRELTGIKNPETQAAMAVALGLCKFKPAAEDLKTLLRRNKHRDELAGYLCIGLALMDDRTSVDMIEQLVQGSVRRPDLLKQAAIALGKMGDKQVALRLREMLEAPSQNLAKLSAIAGALGFIGDRRTVRPLREMLADESLTPLSRAFAAVALGGVGDKEDLPWGSKVAVDLNYRAAVETLMNHASGILDIL